MHALKRFGTAFGGYKMMENYPVPECGPDDIILEIKAAAICGADMKHWGVDNGYDDTNITPDQQQSVRGHEFAGEIVKVGENVKRLAYRSESCFRQQRTCLRRMSGL